LEKMTTKNFLREKKANLRKTDKRFRRESRTRRNHKKRK